MRNSTKHLRMQVKELIKALKENSGRYEEFLRFAGKMSIRRYSATNMWLIFSQKPDAKYVLGMKSWNRFGRRVKKGERGIAILAPVIKTLKEEVENEIVEKEKLVGFKTTYVWDISQTEGKPLPVETFAKPVEGKKNFNSIISRFKVKVDVRKLYGANGATDGFTIFIEKSLPDVHKVKTFFHELTHMKYHFSLEGKRKKKEVKELEAETSAMIICSYLGIDTTSYSIDYMTLWSQLPDKELEKAITNGFKYANEIIKILEVENEISETKDVSKRVPRPDRIKHQGSSGKVESGCLV